MDTYLNPFFTIQIFTLGRVLLASTILNLPVFSATKI